MSSPRILIELRRHAGGGAALEFALILPPMLLILFGILSYGGYFWTSHAVQQIANDGARAAVAGLDSSERKALADASLRSEIGIYKGLDPQAASIVVVEADGQLSVQVRYDASRSVAFALSTLIPMPSPIVSRQAAIRLGGY